MYPWGWGELEGIAQRTDYDLTQHAKHSGQRLDYFDPQTNERYVPYVIEPAAGVNRSMAAFLLSAYDEDTVGGEARQILRLHPRLAPYKVAVLPLSKKDTLTPLARKVFAELTDRYMCDYDDTQSIGKRYRRQDEIGTPLCVTVDFDSLEDDAVTIRDRDTTEQVRVPIDALARRGRLPPRVLTRTVQPGVTRILAWRSGSARSVKACGTPSTSTRPVIHGDRSTLPSAIAVSAPANSSGS